MKKHVVFVVGSYGKYMSPGANIASKVWAEMEKNDDVELTVVTHKEHYDDVSTQENVIQIKDGGTCLHHKCQDKLHTAKGLSRAYYKFLFKAKRAVHYIAMVLRRNGYSSKMKRKTVRLLKKLHSKKPIDVLIPIGEPHDAMFAGLAFKKKYPSVKLMPYQLDRYANGLSLYKLPKLQKGMKKRNLKNEKKLISYSEALFVLCPIYPHYQQEYFNDVISKVVPTEHPMIVEHPVNEKNTVDGEVIKITYAGSLDKKLRNPTEWLQTLCELVKDESLNVQNRMFSFGNCGDIIASYKAKLGDALFDGGKIPYGQVIEEYKSAQFILTIGNRSKEEVPSKVFDCMSYGKPIIHLYFFEEDPCLCYLNRFPFALCLPIEQEKVYENAKSLNDFIRENNGREIEFIEIEKLFEDCTPRYVAKTFYERI